MQQLLLDGLLDAVKDPIEAVERELRVVFAGAQPLSQEIATHLIQSGGKRVRPLVVLLSARLFAPEFGRAVPVAVAAELIHTATLVHDDVIDHADTRRGRATANRLWGNQAAVLTGDMLLARALTLLVEHASPHVVKLMSEMIFRMCAGEIAQNESLFNPDQAEADYLERIRMKTADFFAACCEAGALVGGADAEFAKAAAAFGLHMGISFQIIDDLLDVEGDATTVGKPVGHDLSSGVITLPVLRALDGHPRGREAKEVVRSRRLDDAQVAAILALVHETDGIEYTRRLANQHALAAQNALERIPDSPTRRLLAGLADYMLSRAH